MDQLRQQRDQASEAPESSVLHALVIVAGRHGIDTTFPQLHRSYAFSQAEPSTDALMAMARDLGLESRRLIAKWQDLARIREMLPAIIRLRDGGALILDAIRDDPQSGMIAIVRDPLAPPDALVGVDQAQLAAVWGGEVILIKRRYAITDENQPFGMKWLLGQVLRERRIFVDIGVASFVSTIFAIAPPFILMIVIDRVLVNHSFSTLEVLALAVLLIIAFETALSYFRRFLTEVITTRIDGRLNLYILERMMRLPMQYFEQNPTGLIMSKMSKIWQIRHFLTGQLFGTLLDAVPLLGLVPALLILDWRLSLLVFALTGVIFVIVLSFIRPLGRLYGRVVEAEQAKGSHLVESIYGMRTIKSMALEGRRRQEWDRLVANSLSARHALGLMSNYPQTLSLPFERSIYSGSFLVGAFLILSRPDSMATGAIVAFAMLSMRLASPLVQFARLLQDFSEIQGSIGEVASIMNEPPEQARAGTGLRLPIRGQINFQDVRFRYSPGAPYALKGVTFSIPQGTMFGIMGRSGSGKTTITRLLQGLHPAYEGIIKIDGMDLREIDLNHLRTSIGIVAQENFLFSGTIRDNISIAKPSASFTDIVRAAQMAGAEEFIERMSKGYDTVLEESAVNLSGGQRQRLAIARALLIDPPVLILDEATSALDAESEAIVNANLQRIGRGRTIICVSHRLSMLVPAEAILVMEQGEVYDIGTHEELLHRCDIYKQLWYQQNRHVVRDPERSGIGTLLPVRAKDA